MRSSGGSRRRAAGPSLATRPSRPAVCCHHLVPSSEGTAARCAFQHHVAAGSFRSALTCRPGSDRRRRLQHDLEERSCVCVAAYSSSKSMAGHQARSPPPSATDEISHEKAVVSDASPGTLILIRGCRIGDETVASSSAGVSTRLLTVGPSLCWRQWEMLRLDDRWSGAPSFSRYRCFQEFALGDDDAGDAPCYSRMRTPWGTIIAVPRDAPSDSSVFHFDVTATARSWMRCSSAAISALARAMSSPNRRVC